MQKFENKLVFTLFLIYSLTLRRRFHWDTCFDISLKLPESYKHLVLVLQIEHMMAFIEQEAKEKVEEIDAKVNKNEVINVFLFGARIVWSNGINTNYPVFEIRVWRH